MDSITFASWIRRPENDHLVVLGKSRTSSTPSLLQIFSFDSKSTSLSSSPKAEFACEEGDVVSVAVHPSGDDIVCSTTNGCILFELYPRGQDIRLLAKDLPLLKDVGPQKNVVFSADGSRFAAAGVDGHLRVFEWPNMRILLNEPKAHKSFRDLDFSLDSEFLVSTSTDGSARIWKTNEGVPLTSLARDSDEKIECCRFSRDGTKPFLFCTVQKGLSTYNFRDHIVYPAPLCVTSVPFSDCKFPETGGRVVTAVWDISTWNKIGHKRLSKKPVSVLSTSLDGKYLAFGSNDGDIWVVEVKKMEICHWSKKLHLGTSISSLEFCPSERVVLSTSGEWGATVTKLIVREWKDWQIYLLLLGLFLASAVAFYIFFENSDSFWNFPLGRDQPAKPIIGEIINDSQTLDEIL